MKLSNCWVAVVIVFVVLTGLDMLIHGFLLAGDYAAMGQILRPKDDMCTYMWFIHAGRAIMAVGLVWIYDRGKQMKPYMGQGVRFGLSVAAISCIPTSLVYYAILPETCAVACKQLVFGTIEMVVIGILVAWLRKDAVAKV